MRRNRGLIPTRCPDTGIAALRALDRHPGRLASSPKFHRRWSASIRLTRDSTGNGDAVRQVWHAGPGRRSRCPP